jgi:hypothetical protein
MRFATEQGLKNYVNEELSKALPNGWVVHFRLQYFYLDKVAQDLNIHHFEWRIAKVQTSGGLENNYLLRVTSDLTTFFIIHGNTDAGALPFDYKLLNAKIIYADVLDYQPLSKIISFLIQYYQPNTWGLS